MTDTSRQVFGLRINLADSFPGPCRTQWTNVRSSPLPPRVSPGFRPDSLVNRSLDRLAHQLTGTGDRALEADAEDAVRDRAPVADLKAVGPWTAQIAEHMRGTRRLEGARTIIFPDLREPAPPL
jgi:hypothetical protein